MNMDKNKLKAHGFYRTFNYYPVHDEWAQELYNYIILGYHPGSFHQACFENNLLSAACHSHVANEWQHIIAFMKWLNEHAPCESWGSREYVKSWLALSKEMREEILFKKGFILTDEEVTFKLLETV